MSWDSGDVTFRFVQGGEDFSLPNENVSHDMVKCMLWSINELKICIVEKGKIESNECFIIGGANGGIHAFYHNGEIREIYRVQLVRLFYIETKALLLAFSQESFFHQLILLDDCKVEEKIRVKVNGKWPDFQIVTMRTDMLAMCSGDNEIKIWDLKNDENGTVSLKTAKGFSPKDTITCLSFSNVKDCLSGGTAAGKIANWRHCQIDEEKLSKQWILQEAINIGSKIKMISWSTVSGVLAVSTGITVTLLKEQPILSHMNKNMAVLQTDSKKVSLISLQSFEQHDIQVSITLKGLHMDEKHLALWDDQKVHLYQIIIESNGKLNVQSASVFNCSASSVVVYQQDVCCIEDDKIRIRTFQGTVKQIISLPEIEGNPIMMDISNSWLCIASINGFIRIYDLSAREAHQQYHSKYIPKTVQNFKYFFRIKLNKLGNRVSFTYCTGDNNGSKGNIYPGIMVWDADSDVVSNFNFTTGMTDQQQYEADTNATFTASNRPNTSVVRKIKKEQVRYRLPDYLPGFHCWDSNDSRYLICEANHCKPNAGPNYLLSIFITSEDGLHMQDLQLQSRNAEALFGCTVPYIYFVRKDNDGNDNRSNEIRIGNLILRQVLREFVGLENSDTTTKE
uniref:WD_REPEATS_REGION domain-containing protein n=1 Tax=Elaeophora elaphi TaxID=1147741 RepID=A0A0R3RL20_9BILA